MSALKEASVIAVGFTIGWLIHGAVYTGDWMLAGLLGALCTETIAQLWIRRRRA